MTTILSLPLTQKSIARATADAQGASIIGIVPDSPAYKSGKVAVGDHILRVDGIDVGYGDEKVAQILQACSESQEVVFMMLRAEDDHGSFARATPQRAIQDDQMATTPTSRRTPIMPGEEVEMLEMT